MDELDDDLFLLLPNTPVVEEVMESVVDTVVEPPVPPDDVVEPPGEVESDDWMVVENELPHELVIWG